MLSTFYDLDFTDSTSAIYGPEGHHYTVNIVKSPGPFFIGIYFSTNENDMFVVRKVRKGTSAHHCGHIRQGDIILSLNGKSVMDLSKESMVSLVESLPINENVEIKLCRPNRVQSQQIDEIDEMDTISLQSVDSISEYEATHEQNFSFPEVSDEDKRKLFEDLEVAVVKGDSESVKECMNRHFEQTHVLFNQAPCDPLHLACAKGHQDLVICLSGIIDVNRVSEKFEGTPLFVATKHNQLAIVELLIDNKAKQPEKISYKNSPLHVAIENGFIPIAKLLEAHNSQIKDDTKLSMYSVYLCCQYGQLELLKYWWKQSFDPNEKLSFKTIDNKCSTFLSITFHEKISHQDQEKSKVYRDIVRFLYDKGALIDKEIALTYPEEVFRFLKSKNKDNFPSVVNWSSKHLAYINFIGWLSPYTDNIVELNLSSNRFNRLPDQIPWELPNIERLTICRCSELNCLSDSENPSFCSRLTKVVVSSNLKLTHIPLCWFEVPNLRHLDLSTNALEILPFLAENIWQCKQLNALHLQNNKLKEVPIAIHGAVNLKFLSLSDNRLTNLPSCWNCPLNKLDASHNELTDVPENLSKHWQRSLQYLYLNFNKIKHISQDIYFLSRLVELNLSWNQIETIEAPEKWQCKRLRTLNLSHNLLGGQVAKIAISQQSPVSNWLFSNKSVRSESSPALAELDRSNKLSQNGSSNSIEKDLQFPTIFAEKLNNLNLNCNNLRLLPKEICKLTALIDLDLSENRQLRHLPPDLGRLHNLERLNITKLNIENLPNNMNPKFTDNPSTAAVLAYLRSKLRREETCNRIKIVVLGKEGSGKSTLISNLVGAKNMRKRAISPVCTYWWNLEPPPDKRHKRDMKTLQLCLWELSEPETYNQLHQCFMNGISAVFVLVIRVDGYSFPDITSWLLNIKLRAPRAQVLLVGTFIDKLGDNMDFKTEMRKKSEIILESCARLLNGPKIIDFIGVSANSTTSFNAIKYAIYEHCWQVLKNRKVPLSYNNIHISVLQEKEHRAKRGLTPIITGAQLWEIIMNTPDNDIEYGDEEELNNVADLMHDSGVLLHYSLNVRSLAIMCYYLDPEWLAEKMMRIVGPQGKKRKLTISEALEILRVKRTFDDQAASSNESTDISELMATHVIEIMQRFELLLLLNKNLVLIPCKLPAEGPEMDLNLRGSIISRLYRMACTPSGFWSRLIVRLLVRLEDALPHKYTPRNLSMSERKMSTLQSAATLRHTMTSYDVGNMWQLLYWAEGIILQVKEGCLKVEALKQSFLRENFAHDDVNGAEGLLVTWQSRYNEVEYNTIELVLFTIAVDETDLLISEWFPDFDFGEDRIQRYVLCPSCLINLMQKQISFDPNVVHLTDCVGCFPLEALAGCALKSAEIACPLHSSEFMPLRNLVPDLLLADIPNLHCLNPKNLVRDTYVTKGGQAALFRGHYCRQEVAIKTFLAADNIVHVGSFGEALTCRTVTRPTITANLLAPPLSNSGSSGSSDFFSPDNELPILFAFQRMRREVVFIASLNHPSIISIVGAMVHPCQPLCFILEFAALGNLSDYLSQKRDLARRDLYEPIGLPSDDAGTLFTCIVPRQLTYKFAWQIIVALQYLHVQGILFRDLKADNILVWSENCDALVNVKLSDYGISCYSAPQGILGNEGTPGYQAPEVLKNMTYDDKADIFSYGMVVYELLSGLPPFNEVVSNLEIKKLVKNGKRPALKDVFISPDFWPLTVLMEECWQTFPVDRPPANEIRERMEDFSFAILRQQLFVKLPEYFPSSTKLMNIREPKRLQRSISKKQLNQSTTMCLQPYPSDDKYCWLLFGNEELKCYHVLDVDKCKFVEKDFISMPGSTTVSSCTYNDCIILVNQDEKQTVLEIFKDSQQNYLPIYLDRICLETTFAVTSCCSVSGPVQNAETFLLFLGLRSGEIASLSIDYVSKELLHQFCWTFSSCCNSIKIIVNCQNRLFVASGGFMFVLNYDKSSVEAVICVFTNFDVDYLCIHENSSSAWCASKLGDMLSVYSINAPYALLISINVSHLSPIGISHGKVEAKRSSGSVGCDNVHLCGLLSVKDTIWLTQDEGVIYILSTVSRDFGRTIANLQIPKDVDFKTCLIENIKRVKDSIITLVKFRNQTRHRKLSGSDAEHSLEASRRPSMSCNSNVTSLITEKTKVFVWEAADINRLLNLRQMWTSLRNAEHDTMSQSDLSSRSLFRNVMNAKLSQQN